MAAENSKRFNFRHEENSRKTSMEEAWEDAVHHIKMKKDKVGCEVRQINDIIGKGVFAVKDFKEGEFVLEYDGEYITREDGKKREETYPLSLGSYIFFFLKMCIDATFSTRIGRYVNDSPSADPNCNTEMLRIQMEDRHHLVLFAKRYIHAGEEIRYDYGVTGLSWRKVPKEQGKTAKKIKETDQVKDCFVRLTRLPVLQLTKLESKNKGVEECTSKQARVYGPEFAVESVSVVEIGIATPLEEPIRDCAVESMVEMVEEQINRSGIQMSKQEDETRSMVAVMGHFHQCTPQQFRHAAAGTQCTSICITAIVAAALRAVKDWTSDFIDEVLVGGDQLHLDILQKKGWPFNRYESMLDIDEIPDTIQCQIGINGIKASIGVLEEGSFGYSSYIDTLITSALVNKPNQSFILRMFGSSIAILCTGHQKYSIFDPHARNQNGDVDANGYAGLFHFRDSSEMVAYLKEISSGRNEQIDIYPILVNILWRTPINHTEDSFVPEVTCSATTDMHDGVQETSYKSLNIPSPKACSAGETIHDSEIPAPITPLQEVNIPSPKACSAGGTIHDSEIPAPITPLQEGNIPSPKACSPGESIHDSEIPSPMTPLQKETAKRNSAKLKRPCPFCGEMKGRLTDHLKAKHKNEEQVKNALQLPKYLRDRAFDEMKKEGIFKANTEMIKSGDFDVSKLIRERNQGDPSSLKMCSVCKGFFNAKVIYKHKRTCVAAEGSTASPSSLSVRFLAEDDKYSKEYTQEILESFRDTDYGSLIRKDDFIKRYGFHLYQNIQGTLKKVEKRLSLNSKLRRLAHLFLAFKKMFEEKRKRQVKDCSEMFSRKHIMELQDAVLDMTVNKKTKKVKHSLKVNLKYLLNDVCEVMQASYLIEGEDDLAEELGKFVVISRRLWSSFYKNAEQNLKIQREAELRAPINLPVRQDLYKVREYTKQLITKLSGDGYSLYENAEFCKLRDALVCRLTIFNGRRGGEPSRMLLSELTDAMNDKWIDQYKRENLQFEIERERFGETKIAYIHASKVARLVPVIIPKDCWKALDIITDDEVRRTAGVNQRNEFVFPNTKTSMSHVIGWDCIHRMCREAGLQRNFNATGMRHFLATEYAALNVDPSDREIFYKHMGHSEKINENIYQCPPALREITHVGRVLQQVDMMDDCGGTLNLQNQNFTDVDLDALEEFIGLVAEDIPFCQLLDLSRQIQEEDVTVQPETLRQSKSLLMNKKLQNYARQFFTEDAWLAVKTTLQFLGGLKGDIEIDTSVEEVPGPSKRKIPRVVTSEIEDIALSGGESENVADLQGESEDDMFDDLELENEETESLTVKKTRHMWLPEEDEAIRHFFKNEINDVSRKGNQGTLQVCKKIHTFISKNPVVLKDYDYKEKVKKIRIKVINLRRQNRQRYFKYMDKIQHN
ncbi:uncharacterized protein LOC134268369 isoform X2 [Saccostrea cucullata]|uniref:uncharacterized protein LOC134268369 isoform X2 n=1 Tax=Saccostrea cuccullata TaxID=36930 RepID=UPI002ED070CC